MVIIAIGIDPIIGFVKSSGIPCGRGVQVDDAMRTSAPDVYAAGDILETTNAMTQRTRVLGQWYPAIQQARAAAYSMLDLLDSRRLFRFSTFYNATFLYGLDFASVGTINIPSNGQGYQEIVADPQPRIYRKVLLKDGVPVGVIGLGDRKGVLAFKRAIDHRVNLSSVASKLFAPDFKFNEWLDKQGVPSPVLSVSREGAVAVAGATLAGIQAVAVMGPTALKPQPVSQAFLVPAAPNASGLRPEEMRLSQTKVMTVGRQAGIFLLIDHGTVSRRHAEISYANGQYVLRDLGSSNGTFVNDKPLGSGSVYILKQGDRIRFGKVTYEFQLRSSAGQLSGTGMTRLHQAATGFFDPTAAGQPAPPSGQPILNADGSLILPGATSVVPAAIVATFKETPVLIMVTHGKPEVFHLKMGKRLQLGRDKNNDIVLADVAASRLHAEIMPGPDGIYIRDRDSSNGVMVNRTRIDNPYRLAHGDRITIGSIVIYFIDQRETVAKPSGADAVPPHICSNCGVSNIPIARFCVSCGAPLENVLASP
jgi:pSer/pThr/pTyr-binding forkhead associated (FHA) protein